MADDINDILKAYGPPSGYTQASSGSWDSPEPTGLFRSIVDYGKSLPARAMVGWGDEGRRLKDLGYAGPKEQARDMFGVGHFVDAYDAGREGRYPAAAGNAALGVADLAGPARSKAASVADAALQAWDSAFKARPAQLTERAAQELEKLLPPSGRFNAYSAAHKQRLANANRAAERGIPAPEVPGGRSAEEAQRLVDIINRTWPGHVGAGALAATGATGIPGVVLDDTKSALDPLHALYKDAMQERRSEKEQRQMPVMPGAQPEVDHYWGQLDRLRHERDVHAGMAGGMFAAGPGAAYAAAKGIPWAARRSSLGLAGLGAELAGVHPVLGLGVAALGALPFAVPAGLGWGTWELAKGAAGQTEQALKRHAEAKALRPLVQKILDNYRERPDAPSLNPGQDY